MKIRTLAVVAVVLLSNAFMMRPALSLDCQNQRTQNDMSQCASLDLERETKIINRTYGELRARLNPAKQQQVRDVQLAWIKYKDLRCNFEAAGVEGGSAYPMIVAMCLTGMTRHLQPLAPEPPSLRKTQARLFASELRGVFRRPSG